MIIEPGQFKFRLDQIKEGFGLTASDVAGAVKILFLQAHRPEMTYEAVLTKGGKGDTREPLRFIRKRTAIIVLDKDDAVIWSRAVPGVQMTTPEPQPSSHSKQGGHSSASKPHRAHQASEDSHT